jgi:hypothetical protein
LADFPRQNGCFGKHIPANGKTSAFFRRGIVPDFAPFRAGRVVSLPSTIREISPDRTSQRRYPARIQDQ